MALSAGFACEGGRGSLGRWFMFQARRSSSRMLPPSPAVELHCFFERFVAHRVAAFEGRTANGCGLEEDNGIIPAQLGLQERCGYVHRIGCWAVRDRGSPSAGRDRKSVV